MNNNRFCASKMIPICLKRTKFSIVSWLLSVSCVSLDNSFPVTKPCIMCLNAKQEALSHEGQPSGNLNTLPDFPRLVFTLLSLCFIKFISQALITAMSSLFLLLIWQNQTTWTKKKARIARWRWKDTRHKPEEKHKLWLRHDYKTL